MLDPVGFWSYTRHDDAHSDGELSQLRVLVGKAMGLRLGAEVKLWQDITAIPFGADWAEEIERTINKTTFFMPIVTPRFLKSRNCFDEFEQFRKRMRALGRHDLVFAVHYVNVEGMRAEDTVFGDSLAALQRHQWIDFRPLFYADPRSREVRRWAGDLAVSILDALGRPPADGTPSIVSKVPVPSETGGQPAAATHGDDNATALPEATDQGRRSAVDSGDLPAAPNVPAVRDPENHEFRRRMLILAGGGLIIAALVTAITLSGDPHQPTGSALVQPQKPGGPPPSAPATTTTPTLGLKAESTSTPPAAPMPKPGETFRDCPQGCPQMRVVPAGTFTLGSPASEVGHYPQESPQKDIRIGAPFAVSTYAVTFEEWDECAARGGCRNDISDSGWGRGRRPVVNVNWDDAQRYAAWLSKTTGKPYRLLSEAEYEYAVRAGTSTVYSWGDKVGSDNANCAGCGSNWDNEKTAPVGSFKANAFGLYEMSGNVWSWVEDCWHDTYDHAPSDGSTWTSGDCVRRVVRGGGWSSDPRHLRAASRSRSSPGTRRNYTGFRVARTLAP